MSKVPRVTGAQAKRAFERAGFAEIRKSGSHCILKKTGHAYHLSIPMHGKRPLGVGLLKSLIDAAGLTVEEFTDLL